MLAPHPAARPPRPGRLSTVPPSWPTNAQEVQRAILLRCALSTAALPPDRLTEVVREEPAEYRAMAGDVTALAAEYRRRADALDRLRARLQTTLEGA